MGLFAERQQARHEWIAMVPVVAATKPMRLRL
jgi:hypothetical protein